MSSYIYHDQELNAERRKCCRTVTAAFLFAIFTFTVASIFLFLGWLPSYMRQRQYTVAHCVGVVGRVEWHLCEGGCDGCMVDCWTVFAGVSAVPNITAYMEQATFAQESTAMSAMLQHVGQDVGTCYYADGGARVILKLPLSDPWLILACMLYGVFVVIGLLVALMWTCKKCKERMRLKRSKVMQPIQVEELPRDDDNEKPDDFEDVEMKI
jgi:hypothetical protein